MFEKVNPAHPDKIADRIAGAIVDAAYSIKDNPRIAVEVLIGHGTCHIIAETSVSIPEGTVHSIVERIAGDVAVDYAELEQDEHLRKNQEHGLRCGDNGIFRGMPITKEQKKLSQTCRSLFGKYPTDGKYIIECGRLIACQSNADKEGLLDFIWGDGYFSDVAVNPLGYWTGGTDVDTGATNRKLGSDMGDAVTGGGLHGKDLSKADVSVNIYCHIMAQRYGIPYETMCAIGDEYVDGEPYENIVEIARSYIKEIGGFEKFAEWGLI